MSFVRGLFAGLVIAALQVAAARSGLEYGPFSLRGDGALVVPAILVPLTILWGWTWVSDRWSGRSTPRMFSYTVALVFGASLAWVVDRVDLTAIDVDALSTRLPDVMGAGLAFLVPAVVIAAVLYWLFASGRLPARFLTLGLGYFATLPFALLYPPVTIGAVGGTAAGHAWQSPKSRTGIAFFVIVLMVLAIFGPPFLVLELGPNPPIPLPSVL